MGAPQYLENHDLIRDHGIEEWVRRSADRRISPDPSTAAHNQWYAQQMTQTTPRVVMETLAYLSGQDLSPILPEIHTPALALVAEQSDTNNAGPGRRHGRPDAQLPVDSHPQRHGLRAALGAGEVRGGVAGVHRQPGVGKCESNRPE